MSPSSRVSPILVRLAVLSLLLGMLVPSATVVRATQQPANREGWESARISDDLSVWSRTGAAVTADDFAAAYETELTTALEELLLFLRVDAIAQPIEIEIYDETDAYQAAVATTGRIELDDQIAIADPRNAVIRLPIDPFGSLTPLDAENQLRHALSHVVAGWATDFQIPRGFDEGLAQYVRRPNLPVQARMAALVQSALQNGTLASWAVLNSAGPNDDDATERAQSYAMVAYLIQHRGLPDLWAFFDEMKTAATWRDALDTALAPETSQQIERQWKENIPTWAAGEWRWNLMTGFDLEPARTQLARGNYAGAASALEISEQLLRDVDDPERAADVAALKDQARIGDLAENKMVEAQQALETFAYDRAAAAVAQANEQYAQLPPEVRPSDLIDTYTSMAATGLAALDHLEIAREQSGNWADYADTRALALAAGRDFAALGDTERRDDADHLVRSMDQEQLRIVLLLAALAVLAIGWLALRAKTRGPRPLRWD